MREKLDFLNDPDDRRKFLRFRSTVFSGIQVHLSPLPPFFGVNVDGILIDLSAGGMALQIPELIPDKTKLQLELMFPDHSVLRSNVNIRRVQKTKTGFLIGIEFLDLPDFMAKKINRMSRDFLDCESRIKARAASICLPECAFFSMCDKTQKKDLVKNMDASIHIKFKKAS